MILSKKMMNYFSFIATRTGKTAAIIFHVLEKLIGFENVLKQEGTKKIKVKHKA